MPRKKVKKAVKPAVEEVQSGLMSSWDLEFDVKFKFEANDVHKSFIGSVLHPDTKMVFVDGPAGTAKTFLATYCAMAALKKRRFEELVYIRSVVESASQKMGSLPGEVDDKFLPWSMPLIEKLDEIVGVPSRQDLMNKNIVHCIPVNFVRGLTFNHSFVIVDEAQNLTTGELITILTRFGRDTKFVVVGDSQQSDIHTRSGFMPISKCFDNPESDEKGIYTFRFTENEIVRSEILQFIVKQLSRLSNK